MTSRRKVERIRVFNLRKKWEIMRALSKTLKGISLFSESALCSEVSMDRARMFS